MNDKDWLSKLKSGDKVIVEGTGINRQKSIGIVSRLTQNFIIVKRGGFESKYKKINGFAPGDSYYSTLIREATPDKVEALLLEIKQSKVRKYVTEEVDWNSVPKNVIEEIYVLLDSFVKSDKDKI